MDSKEDVGIKRDGNGYRVFVKVALGGGVSELRTKRFPIDAAKSEMKAWREAQRVDARAHPVKAKIERGTLAGDVERYRAQVRAMPTFRTRMQHLAEWVAVYGDLRRDKITTEQINAQLQTWRTIGPVTIYVPRTGERRIKRDDNGKPVGLSASACNHRRTALLHLFTKLDGKGSYNPVRDAPTFTEPPPAPRARPVGAMDAAIKTLRNPQQRARARVMLWTGIRGNSELGKMTPQHVDLEHAVCYVPNGKGGTATRTVPLTAEGVDAWREFIAANAWGAYDKDALRKSVRLACDKAGMSGVRMYDGRHSIATAYLRNGADVADVQKLLGHSTGRMTRRYAPFSIDKLRAVGAALSAQVAMDRAALAAADSKRLPGAVTTPPQVEAE